MNISQDLPKGLMDIKYSEEKLHNLAKKLNWSGSGVENDPYIIPSNAGLPQEFATVQSKLFINIKNNTFENVDFYRCWNTTVENSSFNKITFLYSFMNTFRKCEINKIDFSFSSGNRFKDCTIAKVSNVFSKKNHFENCILSKRARKRINVNLFDY